jgi:PAS domain S-box-containing protein
MRIECDYLMSDPADNNPIQILYIDDEPALLDITKLFLEKTGDFIVDILDDSLRAPDLILNGTHDAIISDYQMPAKDGITLLKEIRGAGSTKPFIIFTGKGREEVVIEALNSGADYYIQKGGNPRAQFAELSHKIRLAVNFRRVERKIAENLDELNAAYEQLTATEEELRASYDELAEREEYIRRSERRLSDIINFLPDATFAINCEGKVIAWNRAIEEMTGIGADDVVGRGEYEYAHLFYGERRPLLIDYVLKGNFDEADEHYTDIRRKGESFITETRSASTQGEKRVLWATASRFYDEEGKVTGAIESIRDVTEQRLHEDELLDAHEELTVQEEELRQQLDETSAAQESLRQSEERYRAIFENTGCPVAIFDQNLIITKVNTLFEELSGYTADEIEGKMKTLSFIHPDDIERIIGYHRARRQEGDVPRQYQFRFLRRNGEERIILISIGLLVGENASIASLIDITDLKHAEERVKELGELLEGSKNEIYIFDAETLHFLWVNRGARENLGFTQNELANMTPVDLKPEFTSGLFAEMIAPMLNGEKEYSEFQTVHKRADGSLYPVDVHLQISHFEGKPAFVALIIDITKRRRAEEENRIRERILSKVMEILPIGLWIADSEGNLITGNPAGVAIWGAEPHVGIEEYGVFRARRLPSGEEIAPDDWALARSIREGVTITEELLEIDSFDGQKRLIYNYTAPVILDDGRLHGAIVVNRDVTEEKMAEEALRLFNRKLRLLSGVTRHDIQNQLVASLGYLELISELNEDQLIATYLQKVTGSVGTIQRSISFMKEYEKIGVCDAEWQKITAIVEPLAQSGILINNTCPPQMILADRLLPKVFSNLMDNTIRHGETATSVTISCREVHGTQQIIWEDDGCGVPDEMKEQIFERKVGKNSGYGLFLTREILAISGIKIHEEGVFGRGARFVITVPAGLWKIG